MRTTGRQDAIVLGAGLAAPLLFAGSLALFGALTPGYSHLHRAVSELGAVGAPWGPWFGVFGFLVPGLLGAVVAAELRRRLRAAGAGTGWATGLLVYTAMMALTVVPADFERKFASPLTWAHAVFVMGAPLVFFTVIPGCARALKALGASRTSIGVFWFLGYLPVAEFFLYGLLPNTPGLVQRLLIFTVHLALAWMGVTLFRTRGK